MFITVFTRGIIACYDMLHRASDGTEHLCRSLKNKLLICETNKIITKQIVLQGRILSQSLQYMCSRYTEELDE
jgi:hypothetical protein